MNADTATSYLSGDDLCVIAAAALEADFGNVRHACRFGLADSAAHAPAAGFGDTDVYRTLQEKVGVLGYRILRNHAFPDGNKRTAFLAMVEMAQRNGGDWTEPDDNGDETFEMLVAAAASDVGEAAFVRWVACRIV